jgi:hypothetical protein
MMRRRGTARWLAMRLGIFAVLFQAILFGWHHHDPIWAGHLPIPVLANPTGPPQAIDDEDGCEICQVLHHLTAATADPGSAPRAPSLVHISWIGGAAYVIRASASAFDARGPPPSDAALD